MKEIRIRSDGALGEIEKAGGGDATKMAAIYSPSSSAQFSTRQHHGISPLRIKCSSSSFPSDKESRRVVAVSLVFLHCLPPPPRAIAAGLFDKYVKRKKLEPLESYVPAVILTQLQIKDLEKSLEADQPQYASFRSLLRSGPAASFRANVRAVAQYASDDGNGKTAFDSVDRCLRALEELDSLLLRASRNDPGASVERMKGEIGTAVDAVNSLLKTVPLDTLEKGKAIADAYLTPQDEEQPQELDGELKQLESIF